MKRKSERFLFKIFCPFSLGEKMRVIGVDPGTKSFDIIGLENGKIKLDLSFLSEVVAEKPSKIVKAIEDFNACLLYTSPSPRDS